MKKFLSVLMAMVLVFSLIPINALAVKETNIQSIEFEDAYTLGKRETDLGSVYTFSVKCTVNFTNGTQEVAYVTGGEGLQESIRLSNGELYNIEFSSNDEYFESLGDSREYIGTIQGVSDTFNVTYAGIQNIEVETVERIENWGGYPTGEWDSENQCYENQWFYYDIYPENITVTLSNGVKFSGDSEEISRRMGRNEVHCNAEQSFESQWGIGEHTATISVGSYVDEYIVKVVETPIQSIEVEDLVFMPGTNGSWVTVGDRGTYWMYNTQPQKMSVTLKDGQVLEGNFNEVRQQLGLSPVVFPGPDGGVQTFDNQWGIGEHKVTIDILGYKTDYSVIIQSPIQSIDIEDVSIIGGSNGYYHPDGKYYYSIGTSGTVTFSDGTTREFQKHESIEINGEYYSVSNNAWEMQNEEPWEVGRTYEVTGTLLGVSDTFNVTIVESPIESIEIGDVSIIEGSNSYHPDGKYYYSIGTSGTVTFSDGTTREFQKHESIEINGEYYSVSNNAWEMQNEEPWEVGRTYEVTGTLLGVSDTFNVTIVESPIESLVLEDIVLCEGIDSNNWNGWEQYYASPVLSKVLLKDGTSIDIMENSYIEYNGVTYFVSSNYWELQNENHWEVGKTYEVTGTLLGVSATYNVTIQENPIQSIEIVTNPKKTEYIAGEILDISEMVFRINYIDGGYEEFAIGENVWNSIYPCITSEKLDRTDRISFPSGNILEEIGKQNITFELFGQTCEIPVNVKANSMESITIREDADYSIIVTVTKSDGSTEEMKITEMGDFHGKVFTDKGIYSGRIYNDESGFYIGLIGNDGQEIISNKMECSRLFEVCSAWEMFLVYVEQLLRSGSDEFIQYAGTVTPENIDEIIRIAYYLRAYNDDSVSICPGEQEMNGDDVRKTVAQFFDIDMIDLKMSENYNQSTDSYLLDLMFDGADYLPTYSGKTEYKDGVWIIKKVVGGQISDNRVPVSMTFNEEGKLLGYSMQFSSAVVGDIDDVVGVTDTDAEYLLMQTFFPKEYPVNQNCDFNDDGFVNDADAEHLLMYTFFPEDYPLRA